MNFKEGLANSVKRSAMLVVVLLVALMMDQVKSLRSRGVKCSIIISGSGIGKTSLKHRAVYVVTLCYFVHLCL